MEAAVTAFEEERDQNTQSQEELRSAIGALEEWKFGRRRTPPNRPGRRRAPESRRQEEEKNLWERQKPAPAFFNMTVQQRDAFLTREDGRILTRLREMKGQTRAVNGGAWHPHGDAGPAEGEYWPLLQADQPGTLPSAKGKARQNIAGTVPAAV